MKPRPLHKWKSFWFGILVMGFLGWAWVRSNSHLEGFGYASPATGHGMIFQGSGNIALNVNERTMGPGYFSSRPQAVKLVPAVEITSWDWGQGWGIATSYRVTHWLLMLLFFVPWVAFLAWRWRKQRKLAEDDSG